VKEKSKGTYGSKTKTYTTWIKKWYPESCDDSGELIYPIPTNVWVAFIGAKKTQIKKDDKVHVKLADGVLQKWMACSTERSVDSFEFR
jgi:hypothetical protein